MTDGDGVLTEGTVVLKREGHGRGVVGDQQGTWCVGEGVVDLEVEWEKQMRGSSRGLSHPTVARQLSADRPPARPLGALGSRTRCR